MKGGVAGRGKKKRVQNRKDYRAQYEEEVKACQMRYDHITKECVKFSELPLSKKTLLGLEDAGFVNMTDIQRESIPHCLRGKDVQAEAVTGSGKTLAFLVPVLECLWRERWSPSQGVGALIVTPTRELAFQIFEVLNKIGGKHDFSAGLVIGGKSIEEERKRIYTTNIVIATPGRLLQHMDQTAGFTCDLLQVLVLDEADRILDLGFSVAMNHIIENLPSDRQTWLFSATLKHTRVSALAGLSLKNPITVSTNKDSTPNKLAHSYVVVNLQNKLEVLYSFIKSHLNCKILVFMSSCKQVQFHNAVLCKLRPGLPVLALYGKQKQLRRVGVYEAFCRKTAAVLLATDIAARGLDIPAVHWVIHMDCPEDVETYIHRSGRTARYDRAGNSLAMFLPSEVTMVEKLSNHGVSLTAIKLNPLKQINVQKKVEILRAESPDIHHWAKKCFVSYIRSIFLQKDKSVFDVKALPLDSYAASLGLQTAPKVKFVKKADKIRGSDHHVEEGDGITGLADDLESGTQNSETPPGKVTFDDGDDSGDDLLTRKESSILEELTTDDLEPVLPRRGKVKTKIAKAKSLIKKGVKANTKITFDEEGNVLEQDSNFDRAVSYDIAPSLDPSQAGGIDVESEKAGMKESDHRDKLGEKAKRKEAKRLRREKKRKREEGDSGVAVTLGGFDDESGESEGEDNLPEKRFKSNDLEDTELLAGQLLGDL